MFLGAIEMTQNEVALPTLEDESILVEDGLSVRDTAFETLQCKEPDFY